MGNGCSLHMCLVYVRVCAGHYACLYLVVTYTIYITKVNSCDRNNVAFIYILRGTIEINMCVLKNEIQRLS